MKRDFPQELLKIKFSHGIGPRLDLKQDDVEKLETNQKWPFSRPKNYI
jgi:hypothetical protein